MANKQTRRTVSISGDTYRKLALFSRIRGQSMSKTLEGLLGPLLGEDTSTSRVLVAILNGDRVVERPSFVDLFMPRRVP